MPWTSSRICPNQEGGHIVVRCKGCGARMNTKNIGWRDKDTKVVSLARSLFDIYDETCTCADPKEFPLVHDCEVDDVEYNWNTKQFEPRK